eukprot:TRINITY_DN32375_c0_g1_i1.p1 TRINITY_DN32375_c0_g1~~TRINITY_DN32375_c0_g1_i1.p1  ORF type:complete len:391 (+),score=127.02 TRINITY_DN32375_c0_g1_i1:37-1209(+)
MSAERHALVVGASGLVGSHVLALVKDSGVWGKVSAVFSRTAAPAHVDVEGVAVWAGVDLADVGSVEAFAASGAVEGVTHVLYCAWRGTPSLEALTGEGGAAPPKLATEKDLNMAMLMNVVTAVAKGSKVFTRAVVLHGTKWYGVHLGPGKCTPEYATPFREDDARNCPADLFYYHQQDWLDAAAAASAGQWSWVCLRPFTVIGHGHGSSMNLGTGLAVYAALLKAQGKGLIFPGTAASYTSLIEATSARLLAEQMEWGALLPAGNTAFNAVNGEVTRWRCVWPQLAAHLGMDAVPPPADGTPNPTVAALVGTPEAAAKWEELVAQHGLRPSTLPEVLPIPFLHAVLNRSFDVFSSMSKARGCGWTGYVDTAAMYTSLCDELAAKKVIPPF